jgi:hypothetical protein
MAYPFQPATAATYALAVVTNLINKTSYHAWTPEIVKSSRLDIDPDWRFAISSTTTNLPKPVKDPIVQAACNFLTIATSYRYLDDNSNDIDPV